ncbi:MAG TPA: hypothetical protein DEQ38_08035 [Elusimicrobia bacterium]|nr:MAG: hypothetical protein A2089_06105 [Elusimicrobia bacterium GWD2_63_28]HCC48045.1 hypothetical protein [Elusimicrobiota bacterium]
MNLSGALLKLSAWRIQLPLLGLGGFLYVSHSLNSGFTREAVRLGLANWAFAQLLYLADAYAAPDEDSFNDTALPEAGVPVPLLAAGLIATAAYIFSFEGQWVFPVFGGLLIGLYSAPALGKFRLKNYAVPKVLINSALFTAAVVLSPAVQRYGLSAAVLGSAAVSGLVIFAAALGLTILLDVRDAAGDAAAGIRTLPVILGELPCAAAVALAAAGGAALAFKGGHSLGALFSLAVGAFAAFSPGKGRAYFEGWLAALNLLLLGSLALKAVR